jgi:cytochrome c-type biogenesis protein CcmH
MTLLIVLMGAAVLLVLALLLRPFWWSTSDAEVSRRSLNTAILREQLAKLEVDRADNLLREEDFAQARDELQKRVLQDAAQDTPVATQGSPKWTVIALVLLVPIAAFGLYALLGSPAAIEGDGGAPHSAQQQEIDNMVAGLAKKLEKDPGNLQGWAVLARSYKVMGRMADAEQAFARAGNFIDNDAQMLVSYADVLVANANGNFAGKPMQLIDKALKVDPNNVMALWLAGTAAFRTEDYTKAVRTWERLLVLLEPGTEDANTLQNALDEAYAKLGKSPAPLVRPAPSAALREAPVAAASASNASVSGEVVLDAALKARAAPNDAVMVIARVPGTRMPVAVLRRVVSELPLKFSLDDSMAMSPQARISGAAQVEIEARISKSGMAQAEPGDLITAVQTVKVGATGVRLLVNKVRP